MNRGKKAMPKEQMKAMRKEVKKAQPKQNEKVAVATLPKKAPLNVLKERIGKSKKSVKISKRTTPGEELQSTPQNLHMEGKRWMKTVVKQNLLKTKTLSKRLSKK